MASYEFFNINPLNRIEEDCVCRAISLALEEDYYTIEKKLYLIAELFECERLCVCCYRFLLDNVYNLMRYEDYKGMYIKDFASINPYGTFLIRIDGHLTCLIDGVIYDLWDCLEEKIDLIWKIR